jgi:predicted RNA-binding protein with PUA-like domain
MSDRETKYWLMKAEPNSRIVKGKDVKVSSTWRTWASYQPIYVKFSVDDFETVGTTPWEGVRNAEARNLMKEMRVGDKVSFSLVSNLADMSTWLPGAVLSL